jgi:hypothetical protein
VDERQAWIARHAAELARVLENPQARAEILALLEGDDQQAQRKRRVAELEQERREDGKWKRSS